MGKLECPRCCKTKIWIDTQAYWDKWCEVYFREVVCEFCGLIWSEVDDDVQLTRKQSSNMEL